MDAVGQIVLVQTAKFVSNNGEHYRYRCQALLTINDATHRTPRTAPSNHRAYEITNIVVIDDITPEFIKVGPIPAIRTLKSRDNVVLGPYEQILNSSLVRLEIIRCHWLLPPFYGPRAVAVISPRKATRPVRYRAGTSMSFVTGSSECSDNLLGQIRGN